MYGVELQSMGRCVDLFRLLIQTFVGSNCNTGQNTEKKSVLRHFKKSRFYLYFKKNRLFVLETVYVSPKDFKKRNSLTFL